MATKWLPALAPRASCEPLAIGQPHAGTVRCRGQSRPLGTRPQAPSLACLPASSIPPHGIRLNCPPSGSGRRSAVFVGEPRETAARDRGLLGDPSERCRDQPRMKPGRMHCFVGPTVQSCRRRRLFGGQACRWDSPSGSMPTAGVPAVGVCMRPSPTPAIPLMSRTRISCTGFSPPPRSSDAWPDGTGGG